MATAAVNHLFSLSETIEKLVFPSGFEETYENRGSNGIPVDILETPATYLFYMDIPGLSKSEIQVSVEEDRNLVIKSNGKRKRGDGGEEGCKYIRLERRLPLNRTRKFKLPEDANTSAVTAKCENGVLTVTVGKLSPEPKSRTVEVAIS